MSHIKEHRCLKNKIHQIGRNERFLFAAFQQGLRQNLSWFLSSHRKMLFRGSLILKPTVRGIFKIAHRLRDRHVFMWQSLEILNVFNTITLKQILWKTQTLFKKLEYWFLVESTKTENTKLLCQKSMFIQTKWGVQNGLFVKNGVMPVTILYFRKFCFSLRPRIKIWFEVPTIQMAIFMLFKRWKFLWGCFFSVSIFNSRKIYNNTTSKIKKSDYSFLLSDSFFFEGSLFIAFPAVCPIKSTW